MAYYNPFTHEVPIFLIIAIYNNNMTLHFGMVPLNYYISFYLIQNSDVYDLQYTYIRRFCVYI